MKTKLQTEGKKIFTIGKQYHGAMLLVDEHGQYGVMFGDGAVCSPFPSEETAMAFIDQTLDPREVALYER